MEIWKAIKGYENRYEVSNEGKIRNSKTFKVLSPRENHRGYLYVNLWKNNSGKNFSVHKLVLSNFVREAVDSEQCCHNDGNRKNNKLDNLRWGTPSENQLDREKHGTSNTGIKNPARKLGERDVLSIRELYASGRYSQREIGKMFGIVQQVVSEIVNGKIWDHI